jgi:enoyl-CoA hydratase/carnithine racemase
MSEIQPVLISQLEGRILYLTLNRPHRGNSLNPPLLLELRKQFVEAQQNEKIRVIVLTGSGEKDFCTGIDVEVAKDLSPEGKTNIANIAGDIATLIFHGKLTIVGINGRAMGMGVVFAAAADYRICIENSVLKMPEVQFNIYPGASCIPIFTRVCGLAITRRILMQGNSFSAEEGKLFHLVDEICESGLFRDQIKQIAKDYSRKNPLLMKLIKFSTINACDLSYTDAIKMESEFADYYRWEVPEPHFQQLKQKYEMKYELTGNPNDLEIEYTRIIQK